MLPCLNSLLQNFGQYVCGILVNAELHLLEHKYQPMPHQILKKKYDVVM